MKRTKAQNDQSRLWNLRDLLLKDRDMDGLSAAQIKSVAKTLYKHLDMVLGIIERVDLENIQLRTVMILIQRFAFKHRASFAKGMAKKLIRDIRKIMEC